VHLWRQHERPGAITEVGGDWEAQSECHRVSRRPVTIRAPCDFSGFGEKSLRRRVSSGLSGRVTGEHIFFARQGRARKTRPQPRPTSYFFAEVRWRTASNNATPVATDTFRLSTAPAMGIDTS
jgi:hypothetical protein